MTERPPVEAVLLTCAKAWSWRATCPRRQVGAVLVDVNFHVLATGYNGPPRGQAHCTDEPCPGAGELPGANLQLCEAVHAEANALLQAGEAGTLRRAHALFCTHSPCLDCVKLLLQTSVRRITFLEEYPHPAAKERWLRPALVGREWVQWMGRIG